MLELRETEIELVPVVTRDDPQVAEQVVQSRTRSLADTDRVATPPTRDLLEQGAKIVEARSEQRPDAVDRVGLAVASGLVHGASSVAAGAVARASRRCSR